MSGAAKMVSVPSQELAIVLAEMLAAVENPAIKRYSAANAPDSYARLCIALERIGTALQKDQEVSSEADKADT